MNANAETGRVLGGPTGLGTAALRIPRTAGGLGLTRLKSFSHVPYRVVGPTPLPAFSMPFTVRLNPHLDRARQTILRWAREMGMLDTGLWNRRKLEGFDFALCAAGIDPDASAEQLDLLSCWLTWGTYGDDYFPAVYTRRADLTGARLFHARMSLFMPIEGAETPAPANPVERGLAELWPRRTRAGRSGRRSRP
jgi:germacradienol/geosmin synthase